MMLGTHLPSPIAQALYSCQGGFVGKHEKNTRFRCHQGANQRQKVRWLSNRPAGYMGKASLPLAAVGFDSILYNLNMLKPKGANHVAEKAYPLLPRLDQSKANGR